MVTTVRRVQSRILLTVLICLFIASGFTGTPTSAQATLATGMPTLGEPVDLPSAGTDLDATVTVLQIVDNYEGIRRTDRGFRWVGIELDVVNHSEDVLDAGSIGNQVAVLDGEGFVYNASYGVGDRTDEESRPELSYGFEIDGGETATGWVFAQVIQAANPAMIVLKGGYSDIPFAVLVNERRSSAARRSGELR